MTGEDEAIARAVLPLLGEHEALTMAQIARAAGIAETELRAVFADKEAVMRACAAMMTKTMAALVDPAG
ncbi:hypothetical protein AB0J80_22025 [Actinoplanes sp. NPDC049548]|uniref:hypothetical protein n=1 Tax=Actinoplanes sp. NPDC049548 TaxID=3155152 RepID=UPI00342A6818